MKLEGKWCPKFSQSIVGHGESQEWFVIMEFQSHHCRKRSLEGGGNVQNCDSVAKNPCEPNCIIWRPMCLSCFSHLRYGINIKKKKARRMEFYSIPFHSISGWNSERINSNHKWGETGQSVFSSIRPMDEQFLNNHWFNCTSHPTTTFILMGRGPSSYFHIRS